MKGFFERTQIQTPAYRSGKGMFSCVSCGLYKNAQSPKMQVYGEGRKGILVIGESPGEEDDMQGKPWQGRIGKFLQKAYRRLGIDLFEDCWSINAVNCRPLNKQGDNRLPTDHEIACCRNVMVLKVIQQYQPRVILLHGNEALTSVIGHRWKQDLGNITKWRGWAIPDREFQSWICPTFHPAYVSRETDHGQIKSEISVIWEQDLKQAFAKAEESFPNFPDERNQVEIFDESQIGEVLPEILSMAPSVMAFDIETTGLKPYRKNLHQIACISFCYRHDMAVVIPMPTERKDLRILRRILEHPKIGKVASNMKYEDTWMHVLHGINVSPWVFDDMQAAHVLDNRPGITGLKFQSYVLFGLLGYDDDIKPYLRSEDTQSPNRVMELVKDPALFRKLMLYCGIDSLMTFHRSHYQAQQLGIELGVSG